MPIRYRAIHQIKDFIFIGKQQLHYVDANRQTVYHYIAALSEQQTVHTIWYYFLLVCTFFLYCNVT